VPGRLCTIAVPNSPVAAVELSRLATAPAPADSPKTVTRADRRRRHPTGPNASPLHPRSSGRLASRTVGTGSPTDSRASACPPCSSLDPNHCGARRGHGLHRRGDPPGPGPRPPRPRTRRYPVRACGCRRRATNRAAVSSGSPCSWMSFTLLAAGAGVRCARVLNFEERPRPSDSG
jgi:hypothetical protein